MSLRPSTKQTDPTSAQSVGEKWFLNQQAHIQLGNEPHVGRTVEAVSKGAIERLEGQVKRRERSPAYLREIRKQIKAYIIPYFGKIPIGDVDFVRWEKIKLQIYSDKPDLSWGTIYQIKNSLRIVLNHALRTGLIKTLPVFKDQNSGSRIKTPRAWFDDKEYDKLLIDMRKNIKNLSNTRWANDAQELYDYVVFNVNSGLRVGEARNIRFCDIELIEDEIDGYVQEVILIKNIKGKRGTGTAKSMPMAATIYKRILGRRKIANPHRSTEKLFLHYHRDMFNEVLTRTNLKWTDDQPQKKRDLTVLRHTYIVFRLLKGVDVWAIAKNCRTSPEMIERNYVSWISARMIGRLNVNQGAKRRTKPTKVVQPSV